MTSIQTRKNLNEDMHHEGDLINKELYYNNFNVTYCNLFYNFC